MDTLITVTNSLSQVLAPKQKLSAILSPSCVHLPLLICVLFLFLAIWWHVHFFNHFTLASLTNLTLFFSHIQAVHPTHFNILLFLPVPVLKSCHFLSVPKAKNFILTSLSIATCSLLWLKHISQQIKFQFCTESDCTNYITAGKLLLMQLKLNSFGFNLALPFQIVQIESSSTHFAFSTLFSMPDTICL